MREIIHGNPSNKKGIKIEEKNIRIFLVFYACISSKRQHSEKEGHYDFIKYVFCFELYKESINLFEVF